MYLVGIKYWSKRAFLLNTCCSMSWVVCKQYKLFYRICRLITNFLKSCIWANVWFKYVYKLWIKIQLSIYTYVQSKKHKRNKNNNVNVIIYFLISCIPFLQSLSFAFTKDTVFMWLLAIKFHWNTLSQKKSFTKKGENDFVFISLSNIVSVANCKKRSQMLKLCF